MPRILSAEQRNTRVMCAQELLHLSSPDQQGFLSRIVTGDESWVYYYDPKSSAETREWKHHDSPQPSRPRAARSGKKLLLSVFWDHKGILLVDFLQRGHTITGDYYAALIT